MGVFLVNTQIEHKRRMFRRRREKRWSQPNGAGTTSREKERPIASMAACCCWRGRRGDHTRRVRLFHCSTMYVQCSGGLPTLSPLHRGRETLELGVGVDEYIGELWYSNKWFCSLLLLLQHVAPPLQWPRAHAQGDKMRNGIQFRFSQ